MHEGRSAKIADFVAWSNSHITGDEKGQAQIFLGRLFQAFGKKGTLDVGGEPEMRIKKSSEDDGGTSFADYVWKTVVLIEMKKRGVDLSKHYRQAFDDWICLVPNRPRYVVLCNFDRFDVYDFDRQIDSPVDSVSLTELPERVRAEASQVIDGGRRAVYHSLELRGKYLPKDAHAALDAAVLDAYGFSPKADLLKQLLDLNHIVVANLRAGEPVTTLGVPPTYGDPAPLIADGCMRPTDDSQE